MSEDQELLSERRDHVGVITFTRPERRNALTPAMLFGLHETLERWAADREVRAVVVTGAGDRAFSSGFDIAASKCWKLP